MSRKPTNAELARIIEAALSILETEWQADIKDPLRDWIDRAVAGEDAPETRRWAARIETYIRAAGTTWARILDRRSGPPYYRTSDAWCGFFANFGFARAPTVDGAPPFRIDPSISEYVMPSTLRINSRPHWMRAGYLNALRGDVIKPQDIKRGDIVTIETNRTAPKAYGDHFVVALGAPDAEGFFETIEGNASGRKPTGPDSRQGVIKNRRALSRVRRVYRLQPAHFVEVES
jgi:hypothetical protein